ncbi:TetR/AcrR family transcriptional regulator [Amycolatopsis jejuensis]|uniref:TetR/AcrR family transcriptional regulator n=1 Tax=Amycolatopsis jejuensis TaxID=330084 RepID=UPI000524CCC7|nr:TetR/AcrR family transcriptional regulator [Amycolatopsis jejuensis]
MGNREALLAGAKKCLVERGWATTSVRDIAEAAGVNHAAIGYHFGSREALLTQVLSEALDELGAEITDGLPTKSSERWPAVIDAFTTRRDLWVALLESAGQAERSAGVREIFVRMLHNGRDGLGGPVPMALVLGLMMQWLLDPEHAPSGEDVRAGLAALT